MAVQVDADLSGSWSSSPKSGPSSTTSARRPSASAAHSRGSCRLSWPFQAAWDNFDVGLVTLDPAVVADHAAGVSGIDPVGLEFTGMTPVSPLMAGIGGWWWTTSFVTCCPTPRPWPAPLIRGQTQRLLAASVLSPRRERAACCGTDRRGARAARAGFFKKMTEVSIIAGRELDNAMEDFACVVQNAKNPGQIPSAGFRFWLGRGI